MSGRTSIRVVAAIALIVAIGFLGVGAYNIGFAQGAADAAAQAGQAAPAVAPYGRWGYGWMPFGLGFGLFGFVGTLLFVLLVFWVIRALIWGGPRRWDRPGDGRGHGPNGPNHGRWGGQWEDRAHDAFEDWHRRAHEGGDAPRDAGQA